MSKYIEQRADYNTVAREVAGLCAKFNALVQADKGFHNNLVAGLSNDDLRAYDLLRYTPESFNEYLAGSDITVLETRDDLSYEAEIELSNLYIKAAYALNDGGDPHVLQALRNVAPKGFRNQADKVSGEYAYLKSFMPS
jgi:hypothetical protein